MEAYVGSDDRASHARVGQTRRNGVMFGPPGIAYVYLVYGMYHCLNVVTEPDGRPAALLVRAVEPVEGIELMRHARLERAGATHRGWSESDLAAERARLERLPDAHLARGPGLVGAAFSVTLQESGRDLCARDGSLHLEAGRPPPRLRLVAGPRIGIGFAGEPWVSVPWRLVDAESPAISAPAGSAGRPGDPQDQPSGLPIRPPGDA